MAINFFAEDIKPTLKDKLGKKIWLKQLALQEKKRIAELNYIFCSDAYLHQMNVQYLGHDALTDIITFDHSEKEGLIVGDIYISWERVVENAIEYSPSAEHELLRVLSHGLLHLCGYSDKSEVETLQMRAKEDGAIEAYVPRGTLAEGVAKKV
jgi:probable rRNA maturation factor